MKNGNGYYGIFFGVGFNRHINLYMYGEILKIVNDICSRSCNGRTGEIVNASISIEFAFCSSIVVVSYESVSWLAGWRERAPITSMHRRIVRIHISL